MENVFAYVVAFANDDCIPLGMVVGALGHRNLVQNTRIDLPIRKLEKRSQSTTHLDTLITTEINHNIDAESKKNLRIIISQVPIDTYKEGNRFGKLPSGTVLYETIDGKSGIALPVYISASTGLPTATVDLKPSKSDTENG